MISDHLNTYPDDNNLSLQKKVYRNNRIIKRIQISILNHYHIHTSMIARFTGCNYSVVHRWSRRSETQGNIFDHPRSGRPPVYTETNQIKTIAFYCQISPLPGCNTWSFRWAARYLKEHRQITGCSMSHSTIHRILQKHALKPHKNKYNLAITDPDFFPKMEHIISLLQNQPENLFSFDECTALQAISRLAPELPPEASKERTLEFDYKRHGTTDLMAFLNPKTGQVFGRCTLNHNTQTLINVFIEHVNTLPANVNIHYIMDNLNSV